MSDYIEIYDVFKEVGMDDTSSLKNTSLAEALTPVADWINEKFSDILEAELYNFSTTSGYARIHMYPKENKGIGVMLGAFSTSANGQPGIGYIKSGSTGGYCSFYAKNMSSVKLKIIRSDFGFVADFTAPTISATKNCNLLVSNENNTAYMVYDDGSFASSYNGNVLECGALPLCSQYEEKMLSKITQPGENFLYEHMFVSDKIITGNVPYTMNGKKYVDVCANTLYRGFALEL
jgi:hypothetical protein